MSTDFTRPGRHDITVRIGKGPTQPATLDIAIGHPRYDYSVPITWYVTIPGVTTPDTTVDLSMALADRPHLRFYGRAAGGSETLRGVSALGDCIHAATQIVTTEDHGQVLFIDICAGCGRMLLVGRTASVAAGADLS